MKLTHKIIDKLEPSGQVYYVYGDEMPGLGVRINPTGRKTFVYQGYVGTSKGGSPWGNTVRSL